MNKKGLIFLILLLVGLTAGYYLKAQSNPEQQVTAVKSSSISSKNKLLEQVTTDPGLAKTNLTEDEKSSLCRADFEAIETLPIKALAFEIANGTLKLNADCLLQKNKSYNFLTGFPEVCHKLENNQVSTKCLSQLAYFKALRIHLATNESDFKNLSTELLIQKFIGLEVAQAGRTSEGLLQLRAAGAELHKRLPDSESAAIAAMLNYIETDPKSLSKTDRDIYDSLANEARNKFPNSWEIFELDMVRQQDISEDIVKKNIFDLYKNSPNSDAANYYMGCVQWRLKNVTQARDFFNKAIEIKPKERYQKSLALTWTTQPPEGICYFLYGFDPENF